MYFKVKVSLRDMLPANYLVFSNLYTTANSHTSTNSPGLNLHLIKVKSFRPVAVILLITELWGFFLLQSRYLTELYFLLKSTIQDFVPALFSEMPPTCNLGEKNVFLMKILCNVEKEVGTNQTGNTGVREHLISAHRK